MTQFEVVNNPQPDQPIVQDPGQEGPVGEPTPDSPFTDMRVRGVSKLPPPPWGPLGTNVATPPQADPLVPPAIRPASERSVVAPVIQREGPPVAAPAPGQPLKPKGDPSQFEYWQSQADKLMKENELLRTEREELGQVDSISRHILGQPPEAQMAILSNVQQTFPGGQPVGSTPEESLKKPERPVKPAGYNPTDAMSDPESPHWKYREANEQYLIDLVEYQDMKAEAKEQQRAQQVAVQQQANNRAQADMQLQQAGWEAPKRARFWRYVDHLGTRASIAEFMKIFEGNEAEPARQEAGIQNKIDEMAREKARVMLPTPLGREGAEHESTPVPVDEGVGFMQGLIERRAKSNPFSYRFYENLRGPGGKKLPPPGW